MTSNITTTTKTTEKSLLQEMKATKRIRRYFISFLSSLLFFEERCREGSGVFMLIFGFLTELGLLINLLSYNY